MRRRREINGYKHFLKANGTKFFGVFALTCLFILFYNQSGFTRSQKDEIDIKKAFTDMKHSRNHDFLNSNNDVVEIENIENANTKDSCLCGLVSFFNPTNSHNRIKNFERFAKSIRRQGVYLVVTELYYQTPKVNGPGLSDFYHGIEVDEFTHTYPVWQKERLLNIGLDMIEKHEMPCQNIAWIDGELIFTNDDWVRSTCLALQNNYTVLQPWADVKWLEEEETKTIDQKVHVAEKIVFEKRGKRYHGLIGFAWAARKEKLLQSRFYDKTVLGGGDAFFLSALENDFSSPKYRSPDIFPKVVKTKLYANFKKWAPKCFHTYEQKIGFPSSKRNNQILHLWHGSMENRKYFLRWDIIKAGDFDPENDISETPHGYLTWNEAILKNPKKMKMVKNIREYFYGRKEDG